MWKSPFRPSKDVHFCPGAGGGAEWNSPAYDPVTNLIFAGEVDWCTTVRLQTRDEVVGVPDRATVDGREVPQSVQHVRKVHARRRRLGGMASRRRRRHRGVEVEAEVQLPDPGRYDADRRRPRVLWRHGRQFLCARRRHRPEAVGSGDRRRDRRRRDHLYGERRAESRGGDRLHDARLADEDP